MVHRHVPITKLQLLLKATVYHLAAVGKSLCAVATKALSLQSTN